MENFDKKIAFIGCGNMGKALASAISAAGFGDDFLFCDHTMNKAQSLAEQLGGTASELEKIVKEGYFIFLAIKPQGLESLFSEISEKLQTRKDRFILVTMAAGVEMETIQNLSGQCDCPVIRIMPNTPVTLGEGTILYCTNDKITDKDKEEFLKILSKSGVVDFIPEDKIDAASALTGCGPAFVYMFAEALADGAVECGLPRDKAMLYAAQTLLGSAKMLMQSGKHPGKLKDEVCSPGGTTIQGVHALEMGAFRGVSASAVTAAYEKTLKINHLTTKTVL